MSVRRPTCLATLSCVCLMTLVPDALGQPGYQKPPTAVADILNAPPTPQVSLSPARDRLLLVEGVRYPPVADLAQPMLRLAGLRINPRTNGPHLPPRYVGLTLMTVADGKPQKVDVPDAPYLGALSWSPDGRRFVFTQTTAGAVELWQGDPKTGRTRRVPGIVLNAAYGTPFHWMPGGDALLCLTVPAGRGEPPQAPATPAGPTVQESAGKKAPVRTYQDLLKNAHDEDLFDYYAASQLVLIDLAGAKVTPAGKPGLYRSVMPSPDGKHLLVTRNHRPYSYLHPASAFPRDVEVWDLKGQVIAPLARLPLADRVPIEGVPTGPREHQWCASEPATVVWAEALDGGDPRKKVPRRDRLMAWAAPFVGEPREVTRTEHRLAGLTWAARDGVALLREYDRDRRWLRTSLVRLNAPGAEGRVVWDRSINDRYGDPGAPLLRRLPNGHQVMWQDGDNLFLAGAGASPQGDRPFLDRFNLTTLQSERLFRCEDKAYETAVALLTPDGSRFLTRRETASEPPNYFIRSAGDNGRKALTRFPDPAPALRGIKKQLVTYQRADGVPLSFTLYLPPGHKPGERLPTVVWAYPREYNDAATAGQVAGSPHHFTTIGGPSHLFFLLQGYAVLDGATMPVVGDPETANNTYLEQIVASAKAAIDKADEMGVTDRRRVGVGGHSYGAFMTANLLAHSDLFRAGIARSGAYNRTLTPFGFQNERRTLWEAPDVYVKMSPFMAADKIKAPLLLIHGEADNNPGTFYVQSQRFYQAIQGNGGTARFVSLPHEAHGYVARESVEHTLFEMIAWFDKYVKNAQAVPEARKKAG